MMRFQHKTKYSLERVNGPVNPLPLIFALMSVLMTGCENEGRQSAGKGDAFPLSELSSQNNLWHETINLAGKKLVVNFWATWCRPCREEMPYLQELSNTLDPGQFAIVGVSIDEDSNLVKEFLLEYNIRYPNYLDQNRHLAENRLGISAYPETLLISQQGVILDRIVGPITSKNSRLQKFLGFSDQARFPSSTFIQHVQTL